MKDSQRNLVLDWMRKIHKMEWAHRYESKKWQRINLLLGISSLILATIITAISTIPGVNEFTVKLIVPIGATIVAILSGLQTFLKPSEIAENFKAKSDEFEGLRHKIEEILEFHIDENLTSKYGELLAEVRDEWLKIGSLNMSDKNFKKAGETIGKLKRYPEMLRFQPDPQDPH